VFALALDDFVIANQLSLDATTQTVSMAIYGAARTRRRRPPTRSAR
jgi:hypothetical protein